MITTILIVLVAVVVLIVIIAVLALHFLRADDSDNFDDLDAASHSAGRAPAKPPREAPNAPKNRRPRQPEAVRPQPASERYRETGPRPSATDRSKAPSTGPRPAAVSSRTGKSAKPASADAQATAWESLSDVDYWAELSADKPASAPVPSAPAPARSIGTARRGPDSKSAARAASGGRPTQRGDAGQIPAGPVPAGALPVRPRAQSARAGVGPSAGRAADQGQTEQFDVRAVRPGGYGNEPATQSLAALARLSGPQPASPSRQDSGPRQVSGPRQDSGPRPNGGPRSAAGPRSADSPRPGTRRRQTQPTPPSLPPGHPSGPIGYSRTPAPMDDDPLTSPSFPAINASDSRSYRARRSSGAHSIPQAPPEPTAARSGGFAEPTTQYPQAQPQAPVANPYGSYVSAPQPDHQDAAARQDASTYGPGYANGQHADATWYGNAANGYLPTPGYNAGDQPTNGYAENGYGARGQHAAVSGYGPVDYQNLTYQDVDYQPAKSVPAGYAPQNQHGGQFDEGGYRKPDPAYGHDGYQGYPGYGAGGGR